MNLTRNLSVWCRALAIISFHPLQIMRCAIYDIRPSSKKRKMFCLMMLFRSSRKGDLVGANYRIMRTPAGRCLDHAQQKSRHGPRRCDTCFVCPSQQPMPCGRRRMWHLKIEPKLQKVVHEYITFVAVHSFGCIQSITHDAVFAFYGTGRSTRPSRPFFRRRLPKSALFGTGRARLNNGIYASTR